MTRIIGFSSCKMEIEWIEQELLFFFWMPSLRPTSWKEAISWYWKHVRHASDCSPGRGVHKLLLEGRTLSAHVFVVCGAGGSVRDGVLATPASFAKARLGLFVVFPASCRELGVYFHLMVHLAVGALLAIVPLGFGLFLLSGRGSRTLFYTLVLGLALQCGNMTVCTLVSGRPPAGPPPPLPVQGADGWVRAGGHQYAVGVQLVQGRPVHKDVVAVGHSLATSECHRVGRVRHGVIDSHQPLLMSALQLLLMQDSVHLHSERKHRGP